MTTPALTHDSASPLYRQLMQRLRADISGGVYPAHSRIPSEQELCETYGVSRVTVRKALGELTQEGLLKRQQGKGTFVCIPRLYSDLKDVNSFHAACRLMGCQPGARLIHAQLVRAGEEDLGKLGCPDPQVVEITRLRLADDMPVMLETNRFPLSYAWLLEETLSGSLYALLEARGILASRGIHEISLTYATAAQARLLTVDPGSALMRLDQVIYDQHDRPLHTSHQVIRGDRFTFQI
ncbi:MAG: GntR family transcriptional regulator [Christensenellaceae bacterium]|nr:GntR family transcriptional regulator [Christensenellaceae bacterium]